LRYSVPGIEADLASRKLVFLGGPRQVGKTTLALRLLGGEDESHPAYFNYDDVRQRAALVRGELPKAPFVVLDEIHKYPRWRNLLKGFYDTRRSSTRFLVTGSARLDLYRRGGDSLQGRYHYHRLHPFSFNELGAGHSDRTLVSHLLEHGGFPEPCLRGDARFTRRWRKERMERVLRDDVRDLESVRDIGMLELLVEALPARVGSPLSVKALSEDLQVSFATVERWIQILERMYVCFRLAPFGAPRIRAVKKERKLYLWDWAAVPDPGPRFENFVACQLLKHCHLDEDTEGYRTELRFLRDVDRRELDFVVLRDGKPRLCVECKTGERAVSAAALYFSARAKLGDLYQVHRGTRDYLDRTAQVRVLPFERLCEELALP